MGDLLAYSCCQLKGITLNKLAASSFLLCVEFCQ